MYCSVPRIVPCIVTGVIPVGAIERPDAATTACVTFVNPKSSSFAPDFVSMMFPGLRSR